MKLYIAGPMRGYRHFNFGAFDAAKARLQALGIEVISPADMDINDAQFDPRKLPDDYDWNCTPEGFDVNDCIRRDVEAVLQSDGVYFLRGWEHSTGSRAEFAIARWAGKVLYFEEGLGDGK